MDFTQIIEALTEDFGALGWAIAGLGYLLWREQNKNDKVFKFFLTREENKSKTEDKIFSALEGISKKINKNDE